MRNYFFKAIFARVTTITHIPSIWKRCNPRGRDLGSASVEAGQGLEEQNLIGATPVFVNFFAEFRPETARALMTIMSECAARGAEEVHLLLSSPGGGVVAGITLHNVLRGMPFKLVTHNAGHIASAGVVVYLAGEERRACRHSTFMLHGVTRSVPEGEFQATWFRESLDDILATEAKTNAILSERTRLTQKQLERFRESEETKEPEAAVKCGIAHRIEDIEIPDDALVYTVQI
jgi:ATP-dependent protease ClpP protease subunit